ncbi:MAG: Ig-like domain-containing protein [Leptospiraceae bacterium]|nr:Ig-like domain-containing protein [Leptospiraceae bacterium]
MKQPIVQKKNYPLGLEIFHKIRNLVSILIFIAIVIFTNSSCISKVKDSSPLYAYMTKLLTADTTPPTVSFTSPNPIDDEFELNRSITILFSKTVTAYTSQPLLVTLDGIVVEGKTEFINNSLIFTPNSDLVANKKYLVNVSGVQDTSGNKLKNNYEFNFTTGTLRDVSPIAINAITPIDESSSIDINAKISIEFSEALDPRSLKEENFILKENGAAIGFDLSLTSENILQLKPKKDLANYTYYNLTVNANVKDTAQLSMGKDFSISFMTSNKKDTVLPEVTQHFPLETKTSPSMRSFGFGVRDSRVGDTIHSSQFVSIDFSEPVNKILPDANIIVTLQDTGLQVPVGIRRGLSSVIIFSLTGRWEEGKKYKVKIGSDVSDLAENSLSKGDFELSFSVAGSEIPPPPPPNLITKEPSNNEQNVGLKVKVKLIFSEPIFRPSVTINTIYVTDNAGNTIPGTYSVENNKVVVFTPDTLLKPKTKYTATVKINVRGNSNKKLDQEYIFSFTTEELVSPSSLAYNSSFYPLNKQVSTAPMRPSYSGFISSCSVSPELPVGLYLLSNCTIYGTPQKVQNTTQYTITGTNAGGSTNTKISIAVLEAGQLPLYVGYANTVYAFVKDVPISSINPSVIGDISSCSISPSLPSGLSFSNLCVISGSPTVLKDKMDYTVTAKNATQIATALISIIVSNLTPSNATTRVVNASIVNATIWEGIGNATVTISLSASPASIIAVDYTTSNGTAVAGTDYTATSGTLYFRSGETSKTVNIPITNDTTYEAVDETFTFQITQVLGDNATLGTSSLALTISDLSISNGLVAYHPFSGNANDTVTSNSSTFYGAGGTQNLPQLVTDRKGNANSAYNFDGTDDYILAGSNVGITGSNPRTISAWVKHPASPSNTIQHLVNWGSLVGSQAYGVFSNSVIMFYGHFADLNTGQALTTNWDHWVFVYNSTTVFTYKNGVFVNQGNFTLTTGDSPLYFGRRMDNIYYYQGSLDDVRVYNRAMDADEVRALYEIEK